MSRSICVIVSKNKDRQYWLLRHHLLSSVALRDKVCVAKVPLA